MPKQPYELARYCRLQKRYAAGREFGRIAAALPLPKDDVLFVDHTVYNWRARDEWSICAYWCGGYAESARLCRELLADPQLPDAERARVQSNLEFSLPHLPATKTCDRLLADGQGADASGPDNCRRRSLRRFYIAHGAFYNFLIRPHLQCRGSIRRYPQWISSIWVCWPFWPELAYGYLRPFAQAWRHQVTVLFVSVGTLTLSLAGMYFALGVHKVRK